MKNNYGWRINGLRPGSASQVSQSDSYREKTAHKDKKTIKRRDGRSTAPRFGESKSCCGKPRRPA